MLTYPNKLKIVFPEFEIRDHRRHLVSISETLTVHRRADGEFLFQLDPPRKLGVRSYARYLIDLAADLDAGYTVIIVDRDRFLAAIEALARQHAVKKERDKVERAAQLVAEHTRYHIRDHLDGNDDASYKVARMAIGYRQRATLRTGEIDRLVSRHGIRTPRAEQLWHVVVADLCDVRSHHRAVAAWDRWALANRPAMPSAATAAA